MDKQETVESYAAKKLPAGICGILLGGLGIHKFILGKSQSGLIMLLVTVLTCGIGGAIIGIIGLVEGIIYLTKSDQDFYQTYYVQGKDWF
jgi:TM2 domain-containing membrane protein YozV